MRLSHADAESCGEDQKHDRYCPGLVRLIGNSTHDAGDARNDRGEVASCKVERPDPGPDGFRQGVGGGRLARREAVAPARFVAFNVCAISDTMFEDALFGHVRGAFTKCLRSMPKDFFVKPTEARHFSMKSVDFSAGSQAKAPSRDRDQRVPAVWRAAGCICSDVGSSPPRTKISTGPLVVDHSFEQTSRTAQAR